MGYTHYFRASVKELPEEDFNLFMEDAKKIIDLYQERADEKTKLYGPCGDEELQFDHSGLGLNGNLKFNLDHESFIITQNPSDFEFCKTARKPYDTVVTAILLAYDDNFVDLVEISTDACDPSEWEEGAKLYEDALGKNSNIEHRYWFKE